MHPNFRCQDQVKIRSEAGPVAGVRRGLRVGGVGPADGLAAARNLELSKRNGSEGSQRILQDLKNIFKTLQDF